MMDGQIPVHRPLPEIIEVISQNFYEVTGQTIAIRTWPGNAYYRQAQHQFTGFCWEINQIAEGAETCDRCFDDLPMLEKRPHIETCPFGLAKMLVPVYIGDELIAYIVTGQVLLEEQKDSFFTNLPTHAERLGIDYSMLYRKALRLKVMKPEQLEAQGHLLVMLADYIGYTEAEKDASARYLREYKRGVELEREKKEIEFRFLQSQIRPHFIFNTLNILALLARKENAPQVAGLIYDFADILRISVKSKDALNPVEREIAGVRSYLSIQAVRWGERLTVRIDAAPAVYDRLIPVLTIQPLVENTVVHGMPEDGRLVVDVTVRDAGGMTEIIVADNGTGMRADLLEDIVAMKHPGEGLVNVIKRMKLHYGDRFSYKITSAPMQGACIELRFPS